MPEPQPTTKDRRVSLPPKTDQEAGFAIGKIIGLHGGSHIVSLIKKINPNATAGNIYAGVRDEALVNCSHLLGIPESWALDGQTGAETYKFKFSPKNGEPLDTPEARLAFMEYRISDELGKIDGSSLELLNVKLKNSRTGIISVGDNIGAIVHSQAGSEQTHSPSQSTPETAKAVDLKALKCEQCGSNDFHFDSKLFEESIPPGGEKPLFRQMVVSPEDNVAVIQGFDSSAMFKPFAPIVLKCGHCETDHTLGDPISGASFLGEFKRYYESKGYLVVVQAKKQ